MNEFDFTNGGRVRAEYKPEDYRCHAGDFGQQPKATVDLIRGSEVKIESFRWLWDGWLCR